MKYFEQLSHSYLSHFCRRLADLINERRQVLMAGMGLDTPSTVLFLDENGKTTVACLADALDVSHQMATQRIKGLEKINIGVATNIISR